MGENWHMASEGKAERLDRHEVFPQLYKPGYFKENKKGIWAASPSKHKDHKWVIMLSGWDKYDDFACRGKFCDPDNFNIYIHNDWKGSRMQEIVDNTVSVCCDPH